MAIPTTNLHHNFTAKSNTTIVSNGLDQWVDTANGYTITSAAATNRPTMDGTNLINGVDCPVFDGVDDYLALAAFGDGSIGGNTGNEPVITRFAVFKCSDVSITYQHLIDAGASFNDNNIYIHNGVIAAKAGTAADYAGSLSNNTLYRVIVKFIDPNQPGYDGCEIYLNGTLVSASNTVGQQLVDGVVIGRRGDSDFGYAGVTIAQVGTYAGDVDVATLDAALQAEWETPSDTTAPTPGGSGALASSNLSSTGFDVTFTKATDDVSAQTALVYKLYTSDNLPLTTDPATVEANGTLQDTQTDVASLSATGLTHGTQYKANIIVEDEAGNKAIYSQLTVTTPFIYGTVTEGGNPVQGAVVWIYTIDSDMSNKTLVESVTTDANGDYAMQSAYDTTKQYFVEVGYFKQVVSGTIDSVPGINFITDTGNFVGQNFSNGQYLFRTTGGTNAGKIYRVIGNTDDGISITPSVAQQFDNTTTYEVVQWYSDEATLIPRRS